MVSWFLVAGPALVAALVLLQWWNSRVSRLPIQFRAVLDTGLHGLVPGAILAPFWIARPAEGWVLPLAALGSGFLLDLDHVIAFRSLSFETCSTQERRPFAHGAAAVLGVGTATLVVSSSPLLASAMTFGMATHLFFDATDDSGIPLLYPHGWILRNLPMWSYLLFLAAGIATSMILAPRI